MPSDYSGSGPGLDIQDVTDFLGLTGGNGNGVAAPAPSPAVSDPSGQAAAYGQTMIPLAHKTIASCPNGYVAVDTNRDGVADACVLKRCARQYGYKPSAKPPIKAGDWNALKKAARTIKKLDRVVKMGNAIVGKKPYRRTSGAHSHR